MPRWRTSPKGVSPARHTGRVSLFRYGAQDCGSLDAGARREWLVADGCGGYAMGTIAGLRTRRYHGLLVVADPTPARRAMALAALDPIVTLPSGAEVRLATHEWASGAIAPQGHTLLETFTLRDGLPRWRWRVGDVVLERTLAMMPGRPVLGVVHTLRAGGPVRLTVEPLCTWRDAHAERHADAGLNVETTGDGVVVEGAYRVAGPGFQPDGVWYVGAFHREEQARGLNPTEDLFRPGRFAAELTVGERLEITAWAGDRAALATTPPQAAEIVTAAGTRNRALAVAAPSELSGTLTLAADAFIVRAPSGCDVVAGYPWFGAWSRDTMIAYEGLFLSTGRAEEGRSLLRGYAQTLSDGMLANTADTGTVEYNTADATLWFVHAVDRHVAATGDTDLAAELSGPLDAAVRHHLAGTRYGIRVDPTDGLLTQGADGYALTWMDAVIAGKAVTPRRGKAVELNALWINALAAVVKIRDRLGRAHRDAGQPGSRPLGSDELDRLRATATASFHQRFPGGGGGLRDVVDAPGGDDHALRPNQLFASGLPYGPMRPSPDEPMRPLPGGAVHAAARALLTPLGLRSLAPDEPGYQGRHRGDPVSRDRAYHQGTVWPWLIGAYADALAATAGRSGPGRGTPPVDRTIDDLLYGLSAHLADWGVGSVNETADGDPPHDGTGCPFQAWSVAEVLRISRGPR